LFRIQAAEALRDSPRSLDRLLREDHQLSDSAADGLRRYFARQETISEIPDHEALLIECLANQACVEYYVHTPLAAPANEAIVRVVEERLRAGQRLSVVPMAADLGFIVVLEGAHDFGPDMWRTLLNANQFAEDFERALADSELLRERFMQVAQAGLLVLRHPHLFATRPGASGGKGQRLLDRLRVLSPDFLLLRQARREAAANACDLAAAVHFVRRLPQLAVRLRWLPEPSPFADSLLAKHTTLEG
jgi:ATP-dependent Lhr-like helicase